MKKSISILIIAFLLLVIIFLLVQLLYTNQKYNNLQTCLSKEVGMLEDTLYNSDYISSSDLSSVENNISSIKDDLSKDFFDDISEIRENINTLDNKFSSISDDIDKIDGLNKKVDFLNTKISSSNNIDNKLIQCLKTTVKDTKYFYDPFESIEETYTTIYEFKPNGEFYINKNKVGIYYNNNILFKDSNDDYYRLAHYYFIDNDLYVNLYFNNEDILSSTNFYKCDNA